MVAIVKFKQILTTMKKLLFVLALGAFAACSNGTDGDNDFDSTIIMTDTTVVMDTTMMMLADTTGMMMDSTQ